MFADRHPVRQSVLAVRETVHVTHVERILSQVAVVVREWTVILFDDDGPALQFFVRILNFAK